MKALVIGATGATGRELVNKLLTDDDFSHVTIFVRTVPTINHKKLKYFVFFVLISGTNSSLSNAKNMMTFLKNEHVLVLQASS